MVTRVQPAPEPLLVDAREAALAPAVLNVKQVAALSNVSPRTSTAWSTPEAVPRLQHN